MIVFRCFVLFALALGLVVFSSSAHAWEEYQSDTGIFTVKMPYEPDETVDFIRANDSSVIMSARMSANIDQRPYKNAVKLYRVNLEQSFGPEIKREDRDQFVTAVLDRYQQRYEARGGVLRDRSMNGYFGKPAGELYMSYNDDELGIQSIRVRVVMSDASRVEQIVEGPESIMDNAETKLFWNSLRVEDGTKINQGSMNEEWITTTSPFALFTMKSPDVASPFVEDFPKVQSTAEREIISTVFQDPILEQSLFYNVYGYRVDETLKYASGAAILAEQHIVRHNRKPSDVGIRRGTLGDTPMLSASYRIRGPQGYPYLTNVELRALFQGKYMIVQEFMGSQRLMQSHLKANLQSLIEFTPERAFEFQKQERAASNN